MIFGNLISLYLFAPFTTSASAPLTCVYLSSLVHLPFSVGYHLFMPMSVEISNKWRNLDITFIYVASIFLTYGLSYYVFPMYVTLFLTMVSAVICARQKHKLNNRKHHVLYLALTISIYLFPMIYNLLTDNNKYTNVCTLVIVHRWISIRLYISRMLHSK